MRKTKNRRHNTPSPISVLSDSRRIKTGEGRGGGRLNISIEIATLPRDRISIAARVLEALMHSHRVWIEELAPLRLVWIVGAGGILLCNASF